MKNQKSGLLTKVWMGIAIACSLTACNKAQPASEPAPSAPVAQDSVPTAETS